MARIRWNELVFGKRKDVNDPGVHTHLSLVAFLAWVGLGADGLSSACYGPEETFKALEGYRHLTPWLVVATVLTVTILSAAYSSTITAFPSGGGGYSVATRTLGRSAGMICGCALVLDYILTVGISISSGADKVFDLLPAAWKHQKVAVAIAGVALLMIMNFRGVKESVTLLLPVFLLFLASHAVLIAMAVFAPASPAPAQAAVGGAPLGLVAAGAILLRSFAHGAGTYTGIEAISNSLTILREPRVQTARRAMFYMAASLSIVAGGLLFAYLRMGVAPDGARTFNAILAEKVFGTGAWGRVLVPVTLASEAALLLVAAQAGFIDGPRVLASMAVDSWVPRWLSRLSDRLTVSNGILIVGLGGLASILITKGKVENLVILYSFSVFVTFLLSQAGMIRYWARERAPLRAGVAVLAALISATVLVALLATFGPSWAGGSLAAILALAFGCFLVKRHYATVRKGLTRLDGLVQAAEADPHRDPPRVWEKGAPTAVFLVSGYNGPGMHTLLGLQRVFPGYFHQMVFVSVGTVDFDRFKGQAEVENLKASVTEALHRYVALVERWGYAGEARSAFGVDAVEELEVLCAGVAADYPRAVFFCGDLIFHLPSALTRLLHERTAEELQRRLRSRGLPLLVIPIRV